MSEGAGFKFDGKAMPDDGTAYYITGIAGSPVDREFARGSFLSRKDFDASTPSAKGVIAQLVTLGVVTETEE